MDPDPGIMVLCAIDAAHALAPHEEAIAVEDETEYPAAAREERAADKLIRNALSDMREAGVEADAEVLIGTPARAIVAPPPARVR